MTDVIKEKQSLRNEIRRRLKHLSGDEKKDESRYLCRRVAEYIRDEVGQSCVVASYANQSNEPDLLGLHDLLPGCELLYPRCEAEHSIELYLVEDPRTGFLKGAYGIREPIATNKEPVDPADVDVFLIPALAYNKLGQRLGKGGGYYDRLLSGVGQRSKLLGVAFGVQQEEKIPSESHDVNVSMVIFGV